VIVLDSSFLIGFYNERDSHHVAGRTLMDQFLAGKWGRGLLLEYVFVEISTVLLLRRNISIATRASRILLDAKELDFVPCSEVFLETMGTFSSQKETRLSFIDAAIASVALRRAGGLILSFDEEFRKIAGLRINPS